MRTSTQFHRHTDEFRRLIITSNDPSPIEITRSTTIPRPDLINTHEEADIILAHQMILVAKDNKGPCTVILDGTDVFVLLLYFYKKHQLKCYAFMESPIQERSDNDIKATVLNMMQ